jgi:hypothetical protein
MKMHTFFTAPDRRYKILKVSTELLLGNLMTNGIPMLLPDGRARVVSARGLPDGCRIEAVRYDEMCDQFWFRLYHESFPVLGAGYAIPEVQIELTEKLYWLSETPTLPLPPTNPLVLARTKKRTTNSGKLRMACSRA